jgi:hypothetical protein
MAEKRILIIGAGALGITCAYLLKLAGTSISFLVRPHRFEALSQPQRLYSYNDHSIKTLEGYRVFSNVNDLQGERFDFVLLTLDGAACRSADGVAILTGLGKALANTGSNLIISGVGIGLYDHVKNVTGFADDHLLQGTMGMFAYQVGRAEMPLPPPVDVDLHNSADIAYYYFPKKHGFMMSASPGKASKAFAKLYNQCGLTRCQRIPARMYAMFTNAFFPFTIASELDGWRGTASLIANSELWQLCCQSQREIMGLKQHGLAGMIFSRLMDNARWEKMMRDMDKDSAAIGFTAFNKFHHGGKVLGQDIQVVENCLSAGEAEGRNMRATRTLLERWRGLHQH